MCGARGKRSVKGQGRRGKRKREGETEAQKGKAPHEGRPSDRSDTDNVFSSLHYSDAYLLPVHNGHSLHNGSARNPCCMHEATRSLGCCSLTAPDFVSSTVLFRAEATAPTAPGGAHHRQGHTTASPAAGGVLLLQLLCCFFISLPFSCSCCCCFASSPSLPVFLLRQASVAKKGNAAHRAVPRIRPAATIDFSHFLRRSTCPGRSTQKVRKLRFGSIGPFFFFCSFILGSLLLLTRPAFLSVLSADSFFSFVSFSSTQGFFLFSPAFLSQ